MSRQWRVGWMFCQRLRELNLAAGLIKDLQTHLITATPEQCRTDPNIKMRFYILEMLLPYYRKLDDEIRVFSMKCIKRRWKTRLPK